MMEMEDFSNKKSLEEMFEVEELEAPDRKLIIKKKKGYQLEELKGRSIEDGAYKVLPTVDEMFEADKRKKKLIYVVVMHTAALVVGLVMFAAMVYFMMTTVALENGWTYNYHLWMNDQAKLNKEIAELKKNLEFEKSIRKDQGDLEVCTWCHASISVNLSIHIDQSRDNYTGYCCVGKKEKYFDLIKNITDKLERKLDDMVERAHNEYYEVDQNLTIKSAEDVKWIENLYNYTENKGIHIQVSSRPSKYYEFPNKDDTFLPTRTLGLVNRDYYSYQNGMDVVNDTIIIEEEGPYLIYSQLRYRLHDEYNWKDGMVFVVHAVQAESYKIPNDGKEDLLVHVKSFMKEDYQGRDIFKIYTSTVVGMFNLEKDWKLTVKSNTEDVISRSHSSNFIGILKLSK